jgi:hypothetical protein
MTETKTEPKGTIVGTCIVCTREIAVRETKTGVLPDGMREVPRWFGGSKPSHLLVHHGYHRPGYGYIIGDCFAVKLPPHELSPYAAEAYRSFCKKLKAEAEEYLGRLESGAVTELHQQETLPVPTTAERPQYWRSAEHDPGWREVAVPYHSNELVGTDRARVWVKLLTAAIAHQKNRIKWSTEEIERMTGAIKDWKLVELREREEPVPDPNKRRRRSWRRF